MARYYDRDDVELSRGDLVSVPWLPGDRFIVLNMRGDIVLCDIDKTGKMCFMSYLLSKVPGFLKVTFDVLIEEKGYISEYEATQVYLRLTLSSLGDVRLYADRGLDKPCPEKVMEVTAR